MKKTADWKTRALLVLMVTALLLPIAACKHSSDNSSSSTPSVPEEVTPDPTNPWLATAVEAPWLTENPFVNKHDGGWVYSAREDCIYAMYGTDYSGEGESGYQHLFRIDHIGETAEAVASFTYGRHGTSPVIDDTGTYIYMPPSQETNGLERYNTVTETLETLAQGPDTGVFTIGAWKNGKLWVVLNNDNLYSYNPATNTWSEALHNFGEWASVASSGPDSDLIYIIVEGGAFFSYNVETAELTTLPSHPFGYDLGGNAEFTWFGNQAGFLYACDGSEGYMPAIYDIAGGVWHEMADPRNQTDYSAHATYDSERSRLYIVGSVDDVNDDQVWYYQF